MLEPAEVRRVAGASPMLVGDEAAAAEAKEGKQ